MTNLVKRLRQHHWSPPERAIVISAIAIAMGSLFVATYSLALGDPVPHRISAALVGQPTTHARTLTAVQGVAGGKLVFHRYASIRQALRATDKQRVYAVLDVTSGPPTLYVASAAGASVARVLERIDAVDPSVRVVDAHPLSRNDPSGVDIFYLMLVTTIVGMITVFQVRGQAGDLELRHHVVFVLALALAGSFVLTLVDGPLLNRPDAFFAEEWGILALHLLAVASFASLMAALFGRWAMIPTWLFFVILGNASSGGAVSPPLLPQPFALLSSWLPSGSTVTALRDAVYFRDFQHAHPIVVLATWAVLLFAAWILIAHRQEASAATAATAAGTSGVPRTA